MERWVTVATFDRCLKRCPTTCFPVVTEEYLETQTITLSVSWRKPAPRHHDEGLAVTVPRSSSARHSAVQSRDRLNRVSYSRSVTVLRSQVAYLDMYKQEAGVSGSRYRECVWREALVLLCRENEVTKLNDASETPPWSLVARTNNAKYMCVIFM